MQLLDSEGAATTIAAATPEELESMVASVKEVVPQASDAVIRAVLDRTHSAEATIATLVQLDASGKLPPSLGGGGGAAPAPPGAGDGGVGGSGGAGVPGGGSSGTAGAAVAGRIFPASVSYAVWCAHVCSRIPFLC